MKNPADVLVRPLITEKSARLGTERNMQYAFEVAPSATKIDIAVAIKAQYKVDVEQVRTLWMKPKPRRLGQRRRGHTTPWKKAIIRLAPNQQIPDFTV